MAINSLHETYFKKLEQMTRDFMESQADDLEKSVDLLVDAWENGKCIYSFGNGGSASTASHLACDLAKFTIIPGKPRLKALCLNDNPSLVSAWTNDSGFGTIFAEQLEPWIKRVEEEKFPFLLPRVYEGPQHQIEWYALAKDAPQSFTRNEA